ncbi:hypothetical protein D3C73_1439750 [compost metagenome]
MALRNCYNQIHSRIALIGEAAGIFLSLGRNPQQIAIRMLYGGLIRYGLGFTLVYLIHPYGGLDFNLLYASRPYLNTPVGIVDDDSFGCVGNGYPH